MSGQDQPIVDTNTGTEDAGTRTGDLSGGFRNVSLRRRCRKKTKHNDVDDDRKVFKGKYDEIKGSV